jgi:hypothetical protein
MRALIAAALLATAASAALAHDGPHRRHASAWAGQADIPGDFRCDAYWDRGRPDCDAASRDQRRWSGQGATGRGGHVWRSGGPGAELWPGPAGRPDMVHVGGSSGAERDLRRVQWCRATYRSYDPGSGYYRTYGGRDVFCG